MDNLTKAIIETGLPEIHQEMVALQKTLESFPAAIGDAVDETVKENVKTITKSAEAVKEYSDELLEQCKSSVEKDLNQAQAKLLVSVSDGINAILDPKLEQLNKLVCKAQNKTSPKLTILSTILGVCVGVSIGIVSVQYKVGSDLRRSEAVNNAMFIAQKETNLKLLTTEQRNNWEKEFTDRFKASMLVINPK